MKRTEAYKCYHC